MSKLCIILFVIGAIQLQVNCLRRHPFRSNNIRPGSHDMGCYRQYHEQRKFFSTAISPAESYKLPSCAEGGLFHPVQCSRDNCFCVYIDTGKRHGNLSLDNSSYRELLRKCSRKPENQIEICEEPPLTYPCKLYQTKYAYNAERQRCEPASFGCFGFKTKEECQSSCATKPEPSPRNSDYNRCTYPLIRQYCGKPSHKHFRFNPETGKCESFEDRRCFRNPNNYKSKWECQKSCASPGNTNLMIQTGFYHSRFRAVLPEWVLTRYHLNARVINQVTRSTFAKILPYALSMISAKRTNLPSTTEAVNTPVTMPSTTTIVTTTAAVVEGSATPLNQEIAEPKLGTPEEVCQLPFKTGFCRGFFPKWYFDANESKCKRFIYGGCSGNDNNFPTEEECKEFCEREGSSTDDLDFSSFHS